MMISDSLQYVFSFTAVLSAIYILFSRKILFCAFALVSCLMSLAGLYILLKAEFVSVIQIMVYVGGVIVLLLFGILLTHRVKGSGLLTGHSNSFPAFIVMIVVFTGLSYLFLHAHLVHSPGQQPPAIREFGILLMTTYLLPMEIVAILLLIVLIGASTISEDFYKQNN